MYIVRNINYMHYKMSKELSIGNFCYYQYFKTSVCYCSYDCMNLGTVTCYFIVNWK